METDGRHAGKETEERRVDRKAPICRKHSGAGSLYKPGIRQRGIEQMAEHDPSAAAKRQMRHKPYQAAALIREQGEQMRREDVAEFVARKYGTDAVKGEIAGG